MTHENEMKVKMEMYAECREHAIGALASIVDHRVEDTCEGVKDALTEIIRHGSRPELATAILLAIKWMWAYLETKEGEKVKETLAMIAAESAAKKPL